MAKPKNPWEPPETTDPWGKDEPTRRHVAVVSDLERPSRHPSLELIRGPGAPKVFTLAEDEVILGRATECGMRVDSTEVSRRHARLVRKDGEYACEDLGSQNGVYLNGIKVHSAVLRDEDQLQVGDAVFLYHEGR